MIIAREHIYTCDDQDTRREVITLVEELGW